MRVYFLAIWNTIIDHNNWSPDAEFRMPTHTDFWKKAPILPKTHKTGKKTGIMVAISNSQEEAVAFRENFLLGAEHFDSATLSPH